MTKEECIDSFDPMGSDVILVELVRKDTLAKTKDPEVVIHAPDFVYDNKMGRDGNVVTVKREAQKFDVCYGHVVKKYQPETDEEVEDQRYRKIKVGDKITFMPYSAPEGTFDEYPELRVMSHNDVIAVVREKKG